MNTNIEYEKDEHGELLRKTKDGDKSNAEEKEKNGDKSNAEEKEKNKTPKTSTEQLQPFKPVLLQKKVKGSKTIEGKTTVVFETKWVGKIRDGLDKVEVKEQDDKWEKLEKLACDLFHVYDLSGGYQLTNESVWSDAMMDLMSAPDIFDLDIQKRLFQIDHKYHVSTVASLKALLMSTIKQLKKNLKITGSPASPQRPRTRRSAGRLTKASFRYCTDDEKEELKERAGPKKFKIWAVTPEDLVASTMAGVYGTANNGIVSNSLHLY